MVLSAAAFVLSLSVAAAGPKRIDIQTADGLRYALVDAIEGPARPTVVVLHGATIGAEATEKSSGFREAALKHGYSVVFPEGVGKVWNDGRSFRAGANDVAFLKILAGKLAADGIADPKRLYIAGVSNGGMMTFRMLCDAPDAFAGAGAVISALGAEIGGACKPTRRMSLAMVSGASDPIVPYKGGRVGFFGGRGAVWGAEQTAEFFALANGCGARKETVEKDGESADTSVTRIDWACDPRLAVTLFRVENGGHQSYGGAPLPQIMFGRTTAAFSAPEAILDHFDAAAGQRK
ncbi:MAG: prolyl oligopeptidase family serine peptidase [Hyphomicrobiales bacterium]|nr:prolyl oligopeptidase family serine peptidase [Hyphomicrobiales bacterium]